MGEGKLEEAAEAIRDAAGEALPQTQQPASIGALVASVTTQVRTLVDDEIRLAKVKVQESVKSLSVGVILLIVTGVLALYALDWGLRSAEAGFATFLPPWGAALAVFGILVVLIIVLALIGITLLKKGQAGSTKATENFKSNMSANVDIIRKGLRNEHGND